MSFWKKLDILLILMIEAGDMAGALNIFRNQMFHQKHSHDRYYNMLAKRENN